MHISDTGRRLLLLSLALVSLAVGAGLTIEAHRPTILNGQLRLELRNLVNRIAYAVAVDAWAERADWVDGTGMQSPLVESGAVKIEDKLYVFGGFADNSYRARAATVVRAYDPANDTWASVSEMPPITHAQPARDGLQIWFAGGFEGPHPGRTIPDVWRYDLEVDEWQPGPSLPQATAGGALVRVGRDLHYIGGFLSDRDTTVGDHWVLSLDGGTEWQSREPLPVPRGHLGAAVVDNRIYAIGGQVRHDTDPIDVDDVHVYDPDTDQWQRLSSLPSPRSHFEPGTFVHDGRVIVVGGRNNQNPLLYRKAGLSSILSYDPDSDAWRQLPALPHGLVAPAARVIDGQLIVTGGSTIGSRQGQTATFVTRAQP